MFIGVLHRVLVVAKCRVSVAEAPVGPAFPNMVAELLCNTKVSHVILNGLFVVSKQSVGIPKAVTRLRL